MHPDIGAGKRGAGGRGGTRKGGLEKSLQQLLLRGRWQKTKAQQSYIPRQAVGCKAQKSSFMGNKSCVCGGGGGKVLQGCSWIRDYVSWVGRKGTVTAF